MSNSSSMSAMERISTLLDADSFVEVGAYVTARNTDFNLSAKDTPKDGVVTGYGVINGKLVFVYSQDSAVLGGAVGEMHAKKIANIYNMALKMGAPVVGLIDSAGLRLEEGVDAMNAFGRLYMKQTMASGVIPQITAVLGGSGGGLSLLSALSDFTYMTAENGKLFVNSPNALDGNKTTDTASAKYVSENTALCDGVFEDEASLIAAIRNLIDVLPTNNGEDEVSECTDDLNRTSANLASLADNAREVITNIADNGNFVEVKKAYANDMVLGFVKLDGETVGCIGNQVADGGDKLTAKGAKVAASFVKFCDAFNIPVVTFVNTTGFAADVANENDIAKATAELTYAFADATVPKVTVVMGKAYGTAYTVMNSKAVGADMVYAWPKAKIGTMDAEMAVKIMNASEIDAASDKNAKIKELAAAYEQSAENAARRGYVDDIIDADATRKRVIAALDMLYTKSEERPYKKHGAI